MKQPPAIALIEDDPDHIRIFRMALDVLNVNAPVHSFRSAAEALAFLRHPAEPPALMLCRLDLATVAGSDLRETLAAEPELRRLAIPLVLVCERGHESAIAAAFRLPVQGLFIREPSFGAYLDQLDRILKYWSGSVAGTPPHAAPGWR